MNMHQNEAGFQEMLTQIRKHSSVSKTLGTIIKPKKITLSITDINLMSTFKLNH